MFDPNATVESSLSLEAAREIDAVCDRFESAWQRGARPRVEDSLGELPHGVEAVLLAELLELELYYRRRAGEAPTEADFRERFPAHPHLIALAFHEREVATQPGAPPEFPGYQLLEVLGRGGMGVVYKARQTSLNRVVALKVLPAGAYVGSQVAARFRIESEAAARLQHPNIVQVYEAGECGGVPFYAMEYVAGRSLAQVLRDGPLPPREAAVCLEQLARAVHYAHDQGVVHRDLKPANIMMAACGFAESARPQAAVPKIADFGLAKALDAGAELTVTGQVLGTPSYMAPEQVGGAAQVGPASDLYSLGAVLYATLTGRPPFRGQTLYAVLAQIGEAEPVPPRRLNPAVPRDLETICLKCLQKEPRRRYATAQDLADDLRRWLKGEAICGRPSGPIERAGRWARRNRLTAVLLLALIIVTLALLVTLGLLFSGHRRAPPGEPSSPVSTYRVSSIRPAVRWAYACSMASQSSGVKGIPSLGPGGSGTSRRAMASHNSGMPAPVRAETWTAPAARLRSHAGGRSVLLTKSRTPCGETSGHSGSALASRTHRQRSAVAAAVRARSMPCPSRAPLT